MQQYIRSLHWFPGDLAWLQAIVVMILAAVATSIAHRIVFFLAIGAARRTSSPVDDAVLARMRRPSRWFLLAFVELFVARAIPFSHDANLAWRQMTGIVVPGLMGWMALATLNAFQDVVTLRSDITAENNLLARRRRTRVAILGRIGAFFIVFVTICLMLLSIPSIRAIGVTLMASAGIAGLVVGAAAQPALKNLIAGIQMAFTEPIRLDDVVIVDGEWGKIEEIRLTFVVIKIWDERRLVVPVSKFLEQSFQNWTRETSQLLGSVFWYVDPATDVPRIRARLKEVIEANPRWDRRFFNLQVTDSKPDGIMELRALMTAKDASTAFDFRCDVREAIYQFLREEMPEALPRRRVEGLPTIREQEPATDPRAGVGEADTM